MIDSNRKILKDDAFLLSDDVEDLSVKIGQFGIRVLDKYKQQWETARDLLNNVWEVQQALEELRIALFDQEIMDEEVEYPEADDDD